MPSRKLKIVGVLCACSAAVVATVFAGSRGFRLTKATAAEPKIFSFDHNVASVVRYSTSPANPPVTNVTTTVSTPIATKFYLSSGKTKNEDKGTNGFASFGYACGRTHVFEAGVNNLTGFEYQFHAAFNTEWVNKFDAILTFYHGNQEVGNTQHSVASLTKNKEYTFSWSKTTEPEVIDRVSCAITMSEGQGEDGWCYLELHYFKLTWSC